MLAQVQNGELVAGIVSAAALVVTLLFLARQTRESTRQSVLANQLAGVQATGEIYSTVDRILYRMLEFPELRTYFYDGVAVPDDGDTFDSRMVQSRTLVFAELFANAIERGLETYRSIDPAADFRTPMDAYTGDIIGASPTLRTLVATHRGWWPYMELWIREHPDI
jgi:hypothetical protein